MIKKTEIFINIEPKFFINIDLSGTYLSFAIFVSFKIVTKS